MSAMECHSLDALSVLPGKREAWSGEKSGARWAAPAQGITNGDCGRSLYYIREKEKKE